MRTVERVLWRVYMAAAWLFPFFLTVLPVGYGGVWTPMFVSALTILWYGQFVVGWVVAAGVWLVFGAALFFCARFRIAFWAGLVAVLVDMAASVVTGFWLVCLTDALLAAALLRLRPARKK